MTGITARIARLVRRWRVDYRTLLAREDAHLYGVRIPSGAWLCHRCHRAFWEASALGRHQLAPCG